MLVVLLYCCVYVEVNIRVLNCRSPKHSRPDVSITHSSMNGYWLVTVKCKDRTKLLFDTVCTLADMDYDVFHATIDSTEGVASQEYYIRPRLGKPG